MLRFSQPQLVLLVRSGLECRTDAQANCCRHGRSLRGRCVCSTSAFDLYDFTRRQNNRMDSPVECRSLRTAPSCGERVLVPNPTTSLYVGQRIFKVDAPLRCVSMRRIPRSKHNGHVRYDDLVGPRRSGSRSKILRDRRSPPFRTGSWQPEWDPGVPSGGASPRKISDRHQLHNGRE